MKKHLILLTILLNTFLITAPLNAQMGDYQTDMELFFKDIFQKNELNQLEDYLKSYAGNVNEIRSKENANLLQLAVRYHASETAFKILLEAGVKPDTYDKNGMTPLLESIKQRNIKTAEIILKNGADPNFFVPSKNQAQIMSSYLRWKKEKVEKACGINASTYPLLFSIKKAQPKFVKLLIQWKAKVNKQENFCHKTRPLHLSIDLLKKDKKNRNKYMQIIELLLKAKVYMYSYDTSLYKLVYHSDTLLYNVYQLFLKYGYDVERDTEVDNYLRYKLKHLKKPDPTATIAQEQKTKSSKTKPYHREEHYIKHDIGFKTGLGSSLHSNKLSFSMGMFYYSYFGNSNLGMKFDLAYQNFYIDKNDQRYNYKALNFNPSFLWRFSSPYYVGLGVYGSLGLTEQEAHDYGFSISTGYMNSKTGIDITFQQGLVKDFEQQRNQSLLFSFKVMGINGGFSLSLLTLTGYGIYKQPVIVGSIVGGIAFITLLIINELKH